MFETLYGATESHFLTATLYMGLGFAVIGFVWSLALPAEVATVPDDNEHTKLLQSAT